MFMRKKPNRDTKTILYGVVNVGSSAGKLFLLRPQVRNLFCYVLDQFGSRYMLGLTGRNFFFTY